MSITIFAALLHNAALLVALVVVFDLATSRYMIKSRMQQVFTGLILGVIGLGIMFAPFELQLGIVFDTRSVLLCVSGLFFGAIPTLIAMSITAIYRLTQGGAAAVAGALVILTSGGIGIAWRHWRKQSLETINWRDLFLLGLLVHAVMLLVLALNLPSDTAIKVLAVIGWPVITLYPLVTMALGGLLANRIERQKAIIALQEKEAHYRMLTEDVSDVLWKTDRDLRITYINPVDEQLRGYRSDEVIGHHIFEMFTEEGIATVTQLMQQRFESERNGTPFGSVTFEVQHRCKDGRLLWGEVLSTPLRDAQGTITGYHGISREITDRRQMQDQVHQLAFYDPLTKLPNRRLLDDRLSQGMATSKRSGCYVALMFLDLDNFKSLNDTHGHEVGDLLLIEVAARLKRCVREMDTVVRFGGDEFVVMLCELDTDKAESAAQAGVIAEKIRTTLANPYVLPVEHEGKKEITIVHHCTASIGVVLFINHEACQDDILKWADKAMYKAKEAGRNGVRFYAANV